MKVLFLKDHVSNKKDETADVADGLGNYLVAMSVCSVVGEADDNAKEKKEKVPVKEKVEKAPAKEKKEK